MTRWERPTRWESVLFTALIVLHVLPIWLLSFVPTQDGPAHLENAMALLRRHDVPALAAYYALNPRLVPNWFSHSILAVLLTAVPPVVAEKLLFSGYAICLPLAYRYALPPRARARGFALAIFPFLFGFNFCVGFSNYSWSLVFYFLALGIWSRSRGRLPVRRAAGFAACTLVLSFTHALTLLVLLLTLGAMLGWRASSMWRRTRPGARRSRIAHAYALMAARASIAILPAAGLVVAFVIGGADGHVVRWMPLLDRVLGLAVLSSIATIGRGDLWVSITLATVIAAALIASVWRGRSGSMVFVNGWLAAAVATAAMAVLAPNEFGRGSGITPRIQMFPFLLALAWLGARRAIPFAVRLVPGIAAAGGIVLLAQHVPVYSRLSASLEEYTSVARFIERGSVLLPLQLTRGMDWDGQDWIPMTFRPFLHAAGYVAATRDVVDLGNYEAETNLFPLRFRIDKDPRVLSRGPGFQGISDFPCLDLSAAGTTIQIDYVLVWSPPDASYEDACVGSWGRQLSSEYELVYVSRPRGFAQLWRRLGDR